MLRVSALWLMLSSPDSRGGDGGATEEGRFLGGITEKAEVSRGGENADVSLTCENAEASLGVNKEEDSLAG